MEIGPIGMTLVGYDISVRALPGAVGGCDVDRLNYPAGYGFIPAGGPMSRAEMEEAIQDFLAGVIPATGFLNRPGEVFSTRILASGHTTYAKPMTVRKA